MRQICRRDGLAEIAAKAVARAVGAAAAFALAANLTAASLTAGGLALFASLSAGPAVAHERRISTDYRGLALKGYDPVAYFESGEAVKGSMAFEIITGGATWRFVSEENRDKFAENPERYAPRFGGFCAYSVTKAKARDADPRFWALVDGRLYLTEGARELKVWRKDPARNIARGEKGWKAILKRCKKIPRLKDCADPR